MNKNKELISSNLKHAKEGYIKPAILSWPFSKNKFITLLITPISVNQNREFYLSGLFIDEQKFMDDIISEKFAEIDDGNLILAVKNREKGSILFTSASEEKHEFEKSEA